VVSDRNLSDTRSPRAAEHPQQLNLQPGLHERHRDMTLFTEQQSSAPLPALILSNEAESTVAVIAFGCGGSGKSPSSNFRSPTPATEPASR
jgi:hypothetical protein